MSKTGEQSIEAALAELVRCETLAQTSDWAARWMSAAAGADGAAVWIPDPDQPVFRCTGVSGTGREKYLRKTAPRQTGLIRDLVRDRLPFALTTEQMPAGDPWLQSLPAGIRQVIAVPLYEGQNVFAAVALLFAKPVDLEVTMARLAPLVPNTTAAIARAAELDKRSSGMLHAIERLTNLYDLTKAFASTLDMAELSDIVAKKAALFMNAEACSLWTLDAAAGEVELAATAVNENFDIDNPPDSVGSSVVGEVLSSGETIIRNELDDDDPTATETEGYPIRSMLATPLYEEEEQTFGALAVANRRGRQREFTQPDAELLADLARQAARAIHNVRQHEAEKRARELDALLYVSQEITATLDLDKVLKTIVNASSAIINYDRCAIAIQQRGKLRLEAISGIMEIDRNDAGVKRLGDLLQWVFYSGNNVSVAQEEDGTIEVERPETEEKFRTYFGESGMRSFHGVVLQDEEGKLGVLAFESRAPIAFNTVDDLLQILVSQATVAVRNAQLYQQVPLVGFWKPLLEKQRRLAATPRRRQLTWVASILAALIVLMILPWNIRVGGTARVLPARRISLTAPDDGVVSAVLRREGDRVSRGDVIASLYDEADRAQLEEAKAKLAIAEREEAQQRVDANPAGMFEATARKQGLLAQIAAAQDRVARTMIRAPLDGVILTPHIEERVGQFLKQGTEIGALGDDSSFTIEVAVPEREAHLLRVGQPVDLKLNPYPTRSFHGTITRLSAEVQQDGDERTIIAESRFPSAGGLLRAGMLGQGKISTGRRPALFALLRRPGRYLMNKFWPILP